MGMDSTVEPKVRTFSNAAKERVKRISLKDYICRCFMRPMKDYGPWTKRSITG